MEIMNVLDRVAQTDDVSIRLIVVRTVKQIVTEYGDDYFTRQEGDLMSAHGSSISMTSMTK